MKEQIPTEKIRFVGGSNDNVYLNLPVNCLGDSVELVEMDFTNINIDSLFADNGLKNKRGYYRRGHMVDTAVLYIWDGWHYDE